LLALVESKARWATKQFVPAYRIKRLIPLESGKLAVHSGCMIAIGLKGLAKFMTASAAQQRKILRDYKYPNEEGQAQAIYYREARDCIRTYHLKKHPQRWLDDTADKLRDAASVVGGVSKTRLNHNARAVAQYAASFGDKMLTVLADTELSLTVNGVKVKINPDLHVQDRSRQKVLKLEFSSTPPDARQIAVICQCMYEGLLQSGVSATSSSVVYLDVPRGQEYRGARQGARMRREIEAACQNITALWPTIQR